MLTESKKAFIEFMMSADVLRFGSFVTKSGRNTPYFVNTGNYKTGEQIAKLGKFYAHQGDRRRRFLRHVRPGVQGYSACHSRRCVPL